MVNDARNVEDNPRICMPTRRHICKQVFHASLYEAEDVLVETNDVDLIFVEPDVAFQWRNRWLSRLAFRDVLERLVLANPGVRRIRLTRDYDLFVAVCQGYEDLLFINGIEGWKDRCRTSICFIDEVWVRSLRKYRHWMSAFRKFDHVFVGLRDTVGPLSKAIGQPCHWIPGAVDTLRFTPCLSHAPRVIDVLGIGRRSEGIHEALRRMAATKGMFYVHDTFAAAGVPAFDYREHREHLARLAQRSRYFLVAPAKMDADAETEGQIDIGWRYFDATAAGAVLIGPATDCAAFRELFDWQDSVIGVRSDGSDVIDILQSLDAQPERLHQISQRNAVQALLRHDWVYRWQSIFEVAGFEPSRGMNARKIRLQKLAEEAIMATATD